MIEKMKFLNLTGPKSQIDRVAELYLSKYPIHLENALSQLHTVKNLRPITEENPYEEDLRRAKELMKFFPEEKPGRKPSSVTEEQAAGLIRSINESLASLDGQKNELNRQLEDLTASLTLISPLKGLNYDIAQILNFRCIKFRFGRMPKDYFRKLEPIVYNTTDTILYQCGEDDAYVFLVYFIPKPLADKIDAVYASMHFEELSIPKDFSGTPEEISKDLEEKINSVKASIQAVEKQTKDILASHRESLTDACCKLEQYSQNFDIRKYAASNNWDGSTFFILCGWMGERDALALKQELEGEKDLVLIIEENHENVLSKPPTKLKNPALFKPFEMYVGMYGLPDYHEIDPTILIGLTYSFLFGFMFGDVGQGLLLLIGGYLLYRTKKMDLAAIVSCCGFFSTIFGFLFGSVFGFEDILDAVWMRPGQAMTTLPFIGRLNTVFVITVAIGMGIILMTMILNMVNSLRVHDTEKTWFDTNGCAGLVFYLALAVTVVLFMAGKPLPASAIMAVMFGVPLLLLFFKEPLSAVVEKKAAHLEGGKGMFVVQGFFELFEVMLSYFSNTVSFVRVGAFAVSHAAMMEVVLMLAGYESGNTNWLVVVFGNLFVCGMEGLIVGIQVLRLEYYELFSRFYRGTGRPFEAYGKCSSH